MVPDNSFSEDTVSVRLERLDLIQQNIATYLPALTLLPGDTGAWAATCYTQYTGFRAQRNTASGAAQGAAMANTDDFDALSKAYQTTKEIAEDVFKNLPARLPAYNFHLDYPRAESEQLERVKTVLLAHDESAAASMTPLIPAAVITRLRDAYDAAMDTDDVQDDTESVSRVKSGNVKERFTADTAHLKTLLKYCKFHFNDDHLMLNDLGFRRSSQMGGGAGVQPPDAPTNLQVVIATLLLTWNAVANATSYKVRYKFPADVGLYIDAHAGMLTTTEFTLAPQSGSFKVVVFANNAGGLSEASEELVVAPGLASPGGFGYNVPGAKFYWVLVAGVSFYRMEASYDGGVTWNEIFAGDFTVGEYGWSPPAGMFRLRAESGADVSAWVHTTVA